MEPLELDERDACVIRPGNEIDSAGHAQAVKVGDILRKSGLVKLVSIDGATREAAWKLFKKYDDQLLSFTDCTSFATMDRFQIQEAFTFDDDFRKVGYTVLP